MLRKDEVFNLNARPGNRLPLARSVESLRISPPGPAGLDTNLLPPTSTPPTWWPREFEGDEKTDQERRAWCAYPPEAAGYLEYARAVLHTASLTTFGVPGRIAQGVIDYAADLEGAVGHRGAADAGSSGWVDPSYETLGSCSRETSEPLVLQRQPYHVSLRRRDLSLLNLKRPTWTGPGQGESFHSRVIMALVKLEASQDHLYTWLSVFFADCRGQTVAYLSRYEPGVAIREAAAAQEVTLVHMDLERIQKAKRDQNRWFHFLHLTRAQWEGLLKDLAAGKRPDWAPG